MNDLAVLLVATTVALAGMTVAAGVADHAHRIAGVWRRARTPRARVLVHPTAVVSPPPGQLSMWRLDPRTRPPRWLRVVAPDGTASEPIRDLPVAAGRAAVLADEAGEAWLVADDLTYAHVTPRGVAPTQGWPVLAARTITSRKVPTS